MKSSTYDVCLIGDRFAATAWATLHSSLRTVWVEVPRPSAVEPHPVWLGNGECAENAGLVFGPKLRDAIWSLSERNRTLATEVPGAQPLPVTWYAHDARTRTLLSGSARYLKLRAEEMGGPGYQAAFTEPGLLVSAAKKPLPRFAGSDEITLQNEGPFDVRITASGATATVPSVIVADETLPPQLFPELHEVWLRPSITTLGAEGQKSKQPSMRLVHVGADWALVHGSESQFGSFRSLYEDRAMEEPASIDTVTVEHVGKFFRDREWLVGKKVEPSMQQEGLSCDGLPIIGALAARPSVFVCGAFAARRANFLFAALELLEKSLSGSGDAALLAPFAPRRFR